MITDEVGELYGEFEMRKPKWPVNPALTLL